MADEVCLEDSMQSELGRIHADGSQSITGCLSMQMYQGIFAGQSRVADLIVHARKRGEEEAIPL